MIPANDAAEATVSMPDQPRKQVINSLSLRDRPTDMKERATLSHWKADRISGSLHTHIGTLMNVNRCSPCW
jgi:IS30 family transposase